MSSNTSRYEPETVDYNLQGHAALANAPHPYNAHEPVDQQTSHVKMPKEIVMVQIIISQE